MFFHLVQSLTFVIFTTCVTACPYAHYLPEQLRSCGSAEPDTALHAQHSYLQRHEPLENDLWNSSLIQDHVARTRLSKSYVIRITDIRDPYTIEKRVTSPPLLIIDTYFHIVADVNNSSPGSTRYVTDEMVSNQVAYLNNAYTAASIAFNLLGVTRTVNDTWARNGADYAMKSALRQGTFSTLNVYYQTMLQSNGENGIPVGSVLLGYCCEPPCSPTM